MTRTGPGKVWRRDASGRVRRGKACGQQHRIAPECLELDEHFSLSQDDFFFLSPREKVFLFILLALLDPLTSLGQLILKFFDAKNGVSETTFSRATLLPKFELCEGPNWTCSAHFCLCNAVSAS